MQQDNLDEMVKDIEKGEEEKKEEKQESEGIDFEGLNLNLPSEEEVKEESQEEKHAIKTVSLSDWFEENFRNFSNINHVKVSIRGIDPKKTLIFSVSDPKGDDLEKRELFLFKESDVFPVLNLTGTSMDVFNNGFKIIYDLGQGKFLKCYGIKTGLIVVSCVEVNSFLIPYQRIKVKRGEKEVVITSTNMEAIQSKLQEKVDIEALELQYRQIQKSKEGITTNADAVHWLMERLSSVRDVNHLLQIDDVLIRIMT